MPAYEQKSVQRVIIPKGLVNPTETTVIEIPLIYSNQNVVVAQKKLNQKLHLSENVVRNDSKKFMESNSFDECLVEDLRRSEPKPKRRVNTNIKLRSGQDVRSPRCDIKSFPNEVLDLDKTEEEEKLELEKTLKEFQKSRRKLLDLTTRITSNTPANKRQLGSSNHVILQSRSDANEENVIESNLPQCKWIGGNSDNPLHLSRSIKVSRQV